LQGHRTLDDLDKSGELNRVQQIGLKHYDDFNERMMREEVEEIETRVSATALVYYHFGLTQILSSK
jgi:molybdopterin synthase catalytic subunit